MAKQDLSTRSVRLTQTVKKGGCAAKLPAGELRKVLSGLNKKTTPELLVGTDTLDDACLWDFGGDQLVVQTLDFFTPIVDDAEDFGRIAAANAISDVYAMGAHPKTALSILAFPTSTLDLELLTPLMAGAIEKIEESGAVLAGGHTIDDETLKLGFSVTGFVPKGKQWTNSQAKEGDVLILTKALGTGVITSALKNDEADEGAILGAIQSMIQLNNVIDYLDPDLVNAATDITGFGLLGHGAQMAQASRKTFRIKATEVPALPGATTLLENGILNKAHRTNAEYTKDFVTSDWDFPPALMHLLNDAQTSGGLLLSVASNNAEVVISSLRTRFHFVTAIGEVTSKGKADIELV